MVALGKEVIHNLVRCSGSKDKNVIEEALQNLLNISSKEGLLDSEFEVLVDMLTSNKMSSFISIKLFQCLVPEKTVSSKGLKDLLSWYFSQIGTGKISKAIEKEFIHWIIGIVHFELGDISIVDTYFHSFLFLLRLSHMESVVAKLLCLLLKPEDAKRWVVKKILEIQTKSGPKAHTNSLLSILKSFRPDIVPESVPMTRLNYEKSKYRDCFRLAHERRIHSSEYVPASTIEITWNNCRRYDKRSAHLPRLIPTPESIDFELSTSHKTRKFHVVETKNMPSLGAQFLRIEIPSQTLSLLTNLAGFHVLAFSDLVTKTRFSHKLRHTLFRVFVLEMEPYSTAEKSTFLDSIVGLQEYMQEGIPAVTEFVLHYMLIWDGEEFRDQILKMMQWIVLKSVREWQKFLFRPIRQIFRSSGHHCKLLLIEAMTSLVRNLIALVERKENFFFDDSTTGNTVLIAKAIEELAAFVGDLVVEGIIWNNNDRRRDIMTCSLNFYDICSMLEYSQDFPVVIVMPPALVYGCLFSGSRISIARMCSLFLRFWRNIFHNLLNLRNGDEFGVEIEEFFIYMLDYYRCLWSNTDYQQLKESFIFKHRAFEELLWEFESSFGVNIKKIFNVENNASFHGVGNLSSDYPSVINLKLLCEDLIFVDYLQF